MILHNSFIFGGWAFSYRPNVKSSYHFWQNLSLSIFFTTPYNENQRLNFHSSISLVAESLRTQRLRKLKDKQEVPPTHTSVYLITQRLTPFLYFYGGQPKAFEHLVSIWKRAAFPDHDLDYTLRNMHCFITPDLRSALPPLSFTAFDL